MKKLSFLFLMMSLASMQVLVAQTLMNWQPRGIGGGGALFAPSINPSNPNEMYIGCDMSELYHTNYNGDFWTEAHFLKIQGGQNSEVQFTNNPSILYSIDYSAINGLDAVRPVKSTDGGANWVVLSGNPDPTETVFKLIANYDNPNQVILGYYGQIHFSNDGGSTFHLIHTAIDNGSGNVIGGVFFEGATIYIGTNDGILVSTDNGASFTTMNTSGLGSGEKIFSFAGAKQGNTIRFFCLTTASPYVGIQAWDYWGFMKGVYSMDNANGIWVNKMVGNGNGPEFPFYLDMASNDINTVYLAGSNNSSPYIAKSTDAGSTWTSVFKDYMNENIYTGWSGYQGDRQWSYGEVTMGFKVCKNNANALVFTDYGFVHKSDDGGNTWKQCYVKTSDQHPMNQATPKGKDYHSIGLDNTTCWQVYWHNLSQVFACFSDIGGIMSNDAGNSWHFMPGINQNSVYRVTSTPNGNIYAATSSVHDLYQSTYLTDSKIDNGQGAIYFSQDNGQSFTVLHDFTHPVIWIASDPNNSNRMYAAVVHSTQGGIYRTDNLNQGVNSTWVKCANPPRTQGHPFNISVLDNGDVVCTYSGRIETASGTPFFANSSGVFISNNQGSSWTDVSHNNMYWWTKDLTIDPNDATQSTWYVAVFSGWGFAVPQGTGGLYKTTNKGQSWTQIDNHYRVNSCTITPNQPDVMYLSTETEGLWFTTSLNTTTPIFERQNDYSFRHPVRMCFNPYTINEIWVTSFGAGMKLGNVLITGNTPIQAQNNRFSFYPNPVHHQFEMDIDIKEEIEIVISLYDNLGQLVWENNKGKMNIGKHHFIYQTTDLAAGVYHLKVNNDIQKLVIE